MNEQMRQAFEAAQDRYKQFRQHRQAFNPSGRAWYRLQQDGEGKATLYIYDAIGFFGIEAESLVREIDQLDAAEITLRINSPGGDVFDGAAIYNALARHQATVHTKIDGLAASMASLIALAGDTVEMAENAFFMIHKPWSIVLGDADTMRSEAEILDKIENTAVPIYARRSNMSEDEVRAALAEETWYSAKEAKEAGFADTVVEGAEGRANSFDLTVFCHAPTRGEEHREVTKREAEAALRDAGMSRQQARATVARGYAPAGQCDAGLLEKASYLAGVLNE